MRSSPDSPAAPAAFVSRSDLQLDADWDRRFQEDLTADAAVERRLLLKECLIVAIIALLVALRETLR